ncbi:MAG: OpgC domain-containing protein [Candidatus Acidiferrales bacterium]
MRRRLELDALRGLMLVWMTLAHLPTVISTFVNQPFGFVSASEGFIFLAALFTGSIYFRLAERDGYGTMRRRLWMRTLRLYGYHTLLLFFAFVVAAQIAVHGNRPGLHNLLDFYFAAGPKRAIIDGALLTYRPPLLDILPIYIIFLLLAPVALTVATRIGWRFILGGGFTLWLLAQIGIRQVAYDFMTRAFGLRIPLNEMGAFDLWAWQFLWVLGLWCGVRWAKDDLPIENLARRMAIPAMLVASALLVLRCTVLRSFAFGTFECLFDKWHLGVVRLFDFAAIAALLVRFQTVVKPLAIRVLVMLGQASLQVFCAHLLFCFLGLAIMGDASRVNGWQQIALVGATLSGLLLTARIFSKTGTREARPTVEDSPSQGSHVRLPMMLPKPAAQRWLTPARERPSQSRSNR